MRERVLLAVEGEAKAAIDFVGDDQVEVAVSAGVDPADCKAVGEIRPREAESEEVLPGTERPAGGVVPADQAERRVVPAEELADSGDVQVSEEGEIELAVADKHRGHAADQRLAIELLP